MLVSQNNIGIQWAFQSDILSEFEIIQNCQNCSVWQLKLVKTLHLVRPSGVSEGVPDHTIYLFDKCVIYNIISFIMKYHDNIIMIIPLLEGVRNKQHDSRKTCSRERGVLTSIFFKKT